MGWATLMAWLAILLNGCVVIEPEWLKVKTVQLSASPECRLVHFTDLHYRGDREYMEKMVRRINEAHPQFVCFTGDFVEGTALLDEALRLLSEIKAPVYGVPGNHDVGERLDQTKLKQGFARTGGAWLLDEAVSVPGLRVRIYGATPDTPVPPTPTPGKLNILLAHYPLQADELGEAKFDLILAGHTHGGQVRLPGFGALTHPYGAGRYEYGLYQTRAGPMYVSSGIGYSRMRLRVDCRPEIVVIER